MRGRRAWGWADLWRGLAEGEGDPNILVKMPEPRFVLVLSFLLRSGGDIAIVSTSRISGTSLVLLGIELRAFFT
jgi:hypothetical protein